MIIHGTTVEKNTRKIIDIDIARLYDTTEMVMSVEVIRGGQDGPTLFLTGAVHGDEINGTEIIRRLLMRPELKNIKGAVIAVPIVNAYGFNTKSRYLPDRRDLNRCFPGDDTGSLASRLAHVLVTDVIDQSTVGIDFHTGAINRSNYPQIRACMDNDIVAKMADDFAAPITMDEPLRDGSLRQYCYDKNIPTILYEGGEALRYSERSIDIAVTGTLSVMYGLGMIDTEPQPHDLRHSARVVAGSHWLRAPESGLLASHKKLGDMVKKDEVIGVMTDAFNQSYHPITAPYDGVIIGATTTPLLNAGDAVYHLAHEQ